MSDKLVIVAIPEDDDPVWQYSSEKVPHMTLLFLGENPGGLAPIYMAEFLNHVVNTLNTSGFFMDVDRRGVLGDDQADVLFFEKNYEAKRLEEVRRNLLKNKFIREAYESVDQFPEWTPHLTMGYPETPAKKDDRERPGFNWVRFDRLAFWLGGYEGPEYRLTTDDIEEVSMSTQAGVDFLEHYGVKGMKWGVIRKRGKDGRVEGKPVSTKFKKTVEISVAPGSKVKIDGKTYRISERKLSEMDTKELQAAVNRLNLEKQYKNLTTQTVAKSKGRQYVEGVLANVAKTQIQGLVNRKVESAIKKKLG